MEVLAGHIDRAPMGKMAAIGKAHAHDRIARLQQSEENRHIGLCAGMRLYVGIFCPEQLLRAGDGQTLHLIDILAAAIVAFARVALCIFICKYAALCFHDSHAHNILRSDHFQLVALAAQLVIDLRSDFRVDLCQCIH